MAFIVYTTRWAAKACLACVTIYQVKLAPHSDSRARFLALVNNECTVFEAKVIIIFREYPKTNDTINKVIIDLTYIGNIFSFNLSLGLVWVFPYMNTLRPVECP